MCKILWQGLGIHKRQQTKKVITPDLGGTNTEITSACKCFYRVIGTEGSAARQAQEKSTTVVITDGACVLRRDGRD